MPTYGSDLTTGITPTCDSQYDASLQCAYGSDDNGATMWNSGTGAMPHWIKWNFGSPKEQGKLIIYKTLAPHCSKDFTYALSSDNISFATVYSDTLPDTAASFEYEFSTTSPYQYGRLQVTNNYSGCGNEANFEEIEILELITEETTMTTSTLQGLEYAVSYGFGSIIFFAAIVVTYLFIKRK